MIRHLAAALLFASSLHAATADLRVTVDAPAVVKTGEAFTATATLENLGPDAASGVSFLFQSANVPCANESNVTLAAGERRTYRCERTMAPPLYRSSASASAHSESIADPNLSNNGAQQPIDLVSDADLVIATAPPLATPGIANPIPVGYANLSRTASSGATIFIRVPRALGFSALPANCSSDGTTATCTVGPIPAIPENLNPVQQLLTVNAILPAEHEASFEVEVEIRGNERDPIPASNLRRAKISTYRAYFVTNTNDSGGGSMRDAIDTANALCRDTTPCQIAFTIDSADAVKTIRPETPLPSITAARLQVDATTQTRFGGDRNPQGPEVELSGAKLAAGSGLVLGSGCESSVRGLAINGFSGFGLILGAPSCTNAYPRRAIEENYIGTDATGTRAVPNERGIFIDGGRPLAPWLVTHNVISGNARSGIWVESGQNDIVGNTIGLDATRTAGLGNGASGVFIGERATATDVYENFIGFNAHAGVSIARNAQYIAVYANSIQANGQGAIDWHLDGPTPGEVVSAPTILTAQYDRATNTTLIQGRANAPGTFLPTIFVHASDAPDPGGYGEGQYYLGSVRANGSWEFRAVGDLRGKWISANVMRNLYVGWLVDGPVTGNGSWQGFLTTTSEFGNAVEVQ